MDYLNKKELARLIKLALREDIGLQDITTQTVISKDAQVTADLIVKNDCVLSGLTIARAVFKQKDSRVKFDLLAAEGSRVKRGAVVARLSGKAHSILAAERVALNFLSLLSAISTVTSLYVKQVKPYKVKIMDTRKTLPGLRGLQKYAVRCGGGFNHRFSLDQMIIIKDNHLKIMNNLAKKSGFGRRFLKKSLGNVKVEIEVSNLKEFSWALSLNPDIIMLDNMSIAQIKAAVKARGDRSILLEVSGGITLKNVRSVAATRVDIISIGALTHSIKSVDMSLEII